MVTQNNEKKNSKKKFGYQGYLFSVVVLISNYNLNLNKQQNEKVFCNRVHRSIFSSL